MKVDRKVVLYMELDMLIYMVDYLKNTRIATNEQFFLQRKRIKKVDTSLIDTLMEEIAPQHVKKRHIQITDLDVL